MKKIVSILGVLFLSAAAAGQAPTGKVEYFTEYGIMTFTFSHQAVTGTYPHEGGKLSGILKDSLMTGTWSQLDGGGQIEIRFTRDFSRFKIRYNHSATPDSTGAIWKKNWTGMRKPETIVRNYSSSFGVMTFNITGTQVEGSYPWYNGKITGELIGTTLTGIWLQGNRGFGSIVVEFSPDFQTFKARYNDNNYHPDKWNENAWKGKLIKL